LISSAASANAALLPVSDYILHIASLVFWTHGSEDHSNKGEVFLNASVLDDSNVADASASSVDLMVVWVDKGGMLNGSHRSV
jgi:hypothetical protein